MNIRFPHYCPECAERLILKKDGLLLCVNILHNAVMRKLNRAERHAWWAEDKAIDGTFRPSTGRPPIVLNVDGERKTIAQLAAENKLPVAESTARHRYERGWSGSEIVKHGPMPPGEYLRVK